METQIIAANRIQLSRRALQGSGNGSNRGERGRKMQSLYQQEPGRRAGGLGCDVDRPLIMAAAAVFHQ